MTPELDAIQGLIDVCKSQHESIVSLAARDKDNRDTIGELAGRVSHLLDCQETLFGELAELRDEVHALAALRVA